ncbi:hypothetical protein Y695_04473 [Hydrogenophaga sp. T4]|nr:hypothetical protein Y695_04473 [Hydrogenophaga sp. T4]
MWGALPMPAAAAKFSLPGLALAYFTSSAMLLAGTLVLTTKRCGE